MWQMHKIISDHQELSIAILIYTLLKLVCGFALSCLLGRTKLRSSQLHRKPIRFEYTDDCLGGMPNE